MIYIYRIQERAGHTCQLSGCVRIIVVGAAACMRVLLIGILGMLLLIALITTVLRILLLVSRKVKVGVFALCKGAP